MESHSNGKVCKVKPDMVNDNDWGFHLWPPSVPQKVMAFVDTKKKFTKVNYDRSKHN